MDEEAGERREREEEERGGSHNILIEKKEEEVLDFIDSMVYRTIRQKKCLSATIGYLKSGRFSTMGRKSRRINSNSADEQQMSDGESDVQSTLAGPESIKTNVKDLDFADRRELQRQKASEKRRSKMKCFLCGKSGHVRR